MVEIADGRLFSVSFWPARMGTGFPGDLKPRDFDKTA
jgi:hypothetical protein